MKTRFLAIFVLATACVATFSKAAVLSASTTKQACNGPFGSFPSNEAPNSEVVLQMPFIAGQNWIPGGAGSFFGNGCHTSSNNDYYATDWNRISDLDNGEIVLPMAPGTVTNYDSTCSTAYGCFVEVAHDNGYRTRYAHLQVNSISVVSLQKVYPWTPLARVGATGNTGGNAHLHLSFQRLDSGSFQSRCNGPAGQALCPNGLAKIAPQGHKPSPMTTDSGSWSLTDSGNEVSTNGTIYLPDLRNSGGWKTAISIRNDGQYNRTARVRYFDDGGNALGSDTCVLTPNRSCIIYVEINNRIPVRGSAVVDGGEALSASVHRQRTGVYMGGMYRGITYPTHEVRLPLVQKLASGNNNDISILNTSYVPNTVTVYFQTSNGEVCPISATLAGRATWQIATQNIGCLTSGALYGVRIVSSTAIPIAVATTQYADKNNDGVVERMLDYEGFSASPSASNYLALLQNRNNIATGLAVQNASAGANSVTGTYYNSNGTQCCNTFLSLNVNSVSVFALPAPTGYLGSGRINGTGMLNALAMQTVANTSNGSAYTAPPFVTSAAVIPVAYKNRAHYQSNVVLSTGISIMNTSAWSTQVGVYYYDDFGNQIASQTFTINSNASQVIFPLPSTIPDGSRVSMKILAGSAAEIAVAVNHTIAGSTQDGYASHSAIPR